MPTSMIEARALTRTFTQGKDTVEAVRGIDLDVRPGELVALLGPNGAGKSTTLRMLTTLLPPSSGTARVAGVDIVDDPAGVRAAIGYIGQKDGAGHNYRVADELRLQGRFYGLNKATASARAAQLLGELDLAGMELRKVSTLSGGQRRRLDIALGLIHEPGLLFLDEPSTGMDPQNRVNLWEHIGRLRAERDTTIVLTTHYLEEADQMAERVVVIDHGQIIADDTPAALKRNLAGDRLTVTVDTAARAEVESLLRQSNWEPEVTVGDGLVTFTVRVESGERVLPDLVRRLADRGVDVRATTLHQPTLDDVFLSLTGRSLREGADA